MDWHLGTAARTAWMEARDQGDAGELAVAHVIANRLKSGRWGKTLFEVCTSEYQGVFQFSCWMRGDPNRPQACQLADADPQLVKLAGFIVDALHGAEDPTGGATHYFNPARVKRNPPWVAGDPARGIKAATFVCKIGAHLFYRDVP